MIRVRVEGKKEIIKNIEKVISNFQNSKLGALSDGSIQLRDSSIDYLRNVAKEPNLSVQGGKITDSSSWVIEPIDNDTVNLKCLSEHASIVELGAEGRSILSTDYGWKGFPVGQQQGYDPVFRNKIRLQSGYHYLENSMNSPDVEDKVLRAIKDRLKINL